jgi:hypothetical protein
MKRTIGRISLILLLFITQNLYSQVLFLEDFDQIPGPTAGGAGTYVFPSGWFLRNVDNLTPAGGVSYVNEAWERREDFNFNVVDSCAFSTSWYSPIGTANDFMWTPLIGPLPANCVLSWNGVSYDPSYPDGYEVRVMTSAAGPPTGGTGTIGNQITSSTVVFSTGAEANAWTSHNVNLNAYTGQSIYVGFRNNSTDKFLLLIDDIKIEVVNNFDAQLVQADTVTEYTMIPKIQVSPLPLEGNIKNNGLANLTNVRMRVDVLDGSMTQIFTNTSSAVATLTPGTTNTFNCGTWTPPSIADTYTLKFYPLMNETDQQPINDTITRTVEITNFTYARDDGTVTGALGIGAGNGGVLGNEFAIYAPSRLTSVGVYYNVGYTGKPFAAVVWNMSGGFPNAIIAYTDTLYYPYDSAHFYNIPMNGGEFILSPGNYVVTAVEFVDTVTLSLGLTNSIFTNNRTWVDWPTNPFSPWGNNEDFGTSFAKAYVIRPEIYPLCPPDIITGFSTTDAGCGLSDGTATVTTTGTGPFTYSWTSGGTNATEAALGIGNYIVTVTDQYSACAEVDTVTIVNSLAPIIDSINTVDPLCFGNNNGSATAFVSGGTPGYSYSWAPSGGTTATAIGLLANTYTLTVTDTANCQTQSTIVLSDPLLLSATASNNAETCLGCNNGTATGIPAGGTGGYTYSWAPSGGTNATATGLAPGNYTVTITDANGCSTTTSTTVDAFVPNGLEDNIGLYTTQVFPNPSNGTFTLTGTINYTGSIKLELTNILGEIVLSKTIMVDKQINNTLEVLVNSGSYILKITAGNQSNVKPLIIK